MPRLGPGLGLDPPTARRRSAFFRDAAYRLGGVAPALVADFARGRFALAGALVPLSSVLAVSSGAKRVFAASGALALVSANMPAFTWRGGKRRLLIEGPATNLLAYSDPRQWTLGGSATVSDGPLGPDGVTPWCRVEDATASQVSNGRATAAIAADTATYVASILVLHDPTAVSNAHLRVSYSGGTGQEYRVAVNPITGAIGDTQGSPIAAYRTNFGTFSLIELVTANNGTNTLATVAYFPAGSSNPADPAPGAGSPSVGWGYIGWGQFEVGTRATSRILSAGSQGSRIADVVQLTAGAAATLQGAAASYAWRGNVPVSVASLPLLGLGSGYTMLRAGPSPGSSLRIEGSASPTISLGGVLPGEIGTAVAWDASGRAGSVNGNTVQSDSAPMDRSRASIWLGGYQGLPAGYTLEIDELVVWPVRGSNAALTAQARGWA